MQHKHMRLSTCNPSTAKITDRQIYKKNIRTMCLYPKLILNKKYTPNRKNNYRPPKLTNLDVKYVPVGCGNCIECRKQKAREWQIRLSEEIKTSAKAYFVTLTFSNENLTKLCKEIKTEECNAVAAIAVRRFLERWRKRKKKSLKHWLITELGHNGTERIHLHGIIWTDHTFNNDILQIYWQYGYCDTGKYVSQRTINYIIKYVTKIDTDHKNYKPQIFCSAGLGKRYINEMSYNKNKYRPNNTNEAYTFADGTKANLPIYYRNKIYTEQEREKLWIERIQQKKIYVLGVPVDISTEEGLNKYNEILEIAQKRNKEAGFGSDEKEWQKQNYNITLKTINSKTIKK